MQCRCGACRQNTLELPANDLFSAELFWPTLVLRRFRHIARPLKWTDPIFSIECSDKSHFNDDECICTTHIVQWYWTNNASGKLGRLNYLTTKSPLNGNEKKKKFIARPKNAKAHVSVVVLFFFGGIFRVIYMKFVGHYVQWIYYLISPRHLFM